MKTADQLQALDAALAHEGSGPLAAADAPVREMAELVASAILGLARALWADGHLSSRSIAELARQFHEQATLKLVAGDERASRTLRDLANRVMAVRCGG